MKKLRILKVVLKRTKADKIITYYAVFLLICSFLLLAFEPNFKNYLECIWYCFAIVSTIGFGDIVAVTVFGKIISMILSVCSIFFVGIVTAIVIGYFNEITKVQENKSIIMLMDDLENLPNLSKYKLEQLSKKIKKMR